MSRTARRTDFAYFIEIGTRWMDNDVYGHVNNVNYYSFFDTAVNRFLIDQGVLDIRDGEVAGFVVESGCTYYRPVAFPDTLQVGVRVTAMGHSSVSYALAIFRDDEHTPSACGHFVHVYVDRRTGQSTVIPAPVRRVLESVTCPSDAAAGPHGAPV